MEKESGSDTLGDWFVDYTRVRISRFRGDMIKSLGILSMLLNFGVIAFIGLKTLDTACFNAGDVSLSLIALVFSLLVEIKREMNNG